MPEKTKLNARQAGLKYAQAIKDNPGKGKKATKSRRNAAMEYNNYSLNS